MSAADDRYLIGVLLQIPLAALGERVRADYIAAGFTDLRPAHQPVLRHLAPEGDRVTDVAARAGTTKQAMGYLVDYLVERGYLERAPDPSDRRARIVRRTERGWAVNRTARRAVEKVQAEWASQLGAEHMAQLLDRLRELVDLVGGVDWLGTPAERETWARRTIPRQRRQSPRAGVARSASPRPDLASSRATHSS
ncbi:MAG TPA: MarR family winged helix-turn-helix transcriptional regulator [Ktedonobacterales bacterium]|jgi:DNA-binding MarR family transcriptional regulator